MELTFQDFGYLGRCLQGFFFGLYSGIFVIYSQHHALHQNTDRAKNILFYALWLLYALSAVANIMDILNAYWLDANINNLCHFGIVEVIVFACCDFIAQCILIYRCWIMWGYSIRVVVVPSFLAFTFLRPLVYLHSLTDFKLWFLVIWIASGTAPMSISQGKIYTAGWGGTLEAAGLALSMAVNALVTGLIVFRIFKVFQEVKTRTGHDQILGFTDARSTLQHVIFILIESGMTLFLIQLTRLVVSIVTTNAATGTYYLIIGIHEMLNGITPTIILVRVSMGLSFHDESSMVEASIGSLHFALDNLNPIPETGSLDEEGRDDDLTSN